MFAALSTLFLIAALAFSASVSAETINTLFTPSSYVVPLKYKAHASTSDHEVDQDEDCLTGRRLHRHRKPLGTAALRAVHKGRRYVTHIEIGSQKFEVTIGINQGDTWVIGKDTLCLDLSTRDPLASWNCSFGPVYTPDETFQQIPNVHFGDSYTDLSYAYGILGHEQVTVAGLALNNQTIGIAKEAALVGDKTLSGMLGLGREWETMAYADSNDSSDGLVTKRPYTPVFANLALQNNLPQIFSLALDGRGGSLAFGYATEPHASADFVHTPLLNYDPRYLISLDNEGLIFEGSNHRISLLKKHLRSTNNGSLALPARFDYSTPMIIVPRVIAENFAAVFRPRGTSANNDGSQSQLFHVDCKADVTPLVVRIAGRYFKISADALIINLGDAGCVSAVMSFDGEELSVLGQPFLKCVFAVFDVGAGEMRFAARVRD